MKVLQPRRHDTAGIHRRADRVLGLLGHLADPLESEGRAGALEGVKEHIETIEPYGIEFTTDSSAITRRALARRSGSCARKAAHSRTLRLRKDSAGCVESGAFMKGGSGSAATTTGS